MLGLVIWAQSACRSQFSLYHELGKVLGVPVIIPVWFFKRDINYVDNRNAIGFGDESFDDMETIPVGEDFGKGLAVLDSHRGWNHIFCNYQASSNFRRLQLEAHKRGEKTAVGSEAPINMFSGIKGLAKELYIRFILPSMLKDVIRVSDFFVNYSGNDTRMAKIIGWPIEKIIPFGYFPDSIPDSHCKRRTANTPFKILSTGVLSRYRGADVLVEALRILKERGVEYSATITQNGELLRRLKEKARKFNLPIEFPGFVRLSDLIEMYESCSVYVGAGRNEPWGMRLNDALHCGAPLVVSRGMGGVSMVDESDCGLAFDSGDSLGLADALQQIAEDKLLYLQCAEKAVYAATTCSPKVKAAQLVATINRRFPGWLE